MVIDENYALHVPDNLNLAGTAPLLCAGITVRASTSIPSKVLQGLFAS